MLKMQNLLRSTSGNRPCYGARKKQLVFSASPKALTPPPAQLLADFIQRFFACVNIYMFLKQEKHR